MTFPSLSSSRPHHPPLCRGVYCLLVCATLLDILTPELVHNTDKFLAGCQTYEGGFASSSFSLGPGLPMPAMAEAHGGYTSCALHSYFLLRPIYAATAQHQQAPIDTDAALRWVVTMQAASIEGGGFKGRTNKLVDGCYGWWVGGLGAVLDALVRVNPEKEKRLEKGNSSGSALEEVEEDWVDDLEEPDMLTNRSESTGRTFTRKQSFDLISLLLCLSCSTRVHFIGRSER